MRPITYNDSGNRRTIPQQQNRNQQIMTTEPTVPEQTTNSTKRLIHIRTAQRSIIKAVEDERYHTASGELQLLITYTKNGME